MVHTDSACIGIYAYPDRAQHLFLNLQVYMNDILLLMSIRRLPSILWPTTN